MLSPRGYRTGLRKNHPKKTNRVFLIEGSFDLPECCAQQWKALTLQRPTLRWLYERCKERKKNDGSFPRTSENEEATFSQHPPTSWKHEKLVDRLATAQQSSAIPHHCGGDIPHGCWLTNFKMRVDVLSE